MKTRTIRAGVQMVRRPNGARPMVVAAAALIGVVQAQQAHAQSLDGTFRLGLEGSLVGHESTTLAQQSGKAIGGDIESSQTTFGAANGAGLALGYGLGDNFVAGAHLLYASAKTDAGPLGQSDTKTVSFLPSVEYLFLTDGSFRPFVSGAVGYQTATSSSGAASVSSGGFLAGPSLGLHAFPTRTFSVDTALGALWNSGSVDSGGAQFDRSGFSVALSIGFSGWLGGSTEAHGTRGSNPESSPAVPPANTHVENNRPKAPIATVNVREERGELSTSFMVEDTNLGQLRVQVAGEPRKDAASASLTISWTASRLVGATCPAAQVEVDGASTPLAEVRSAMRTDFAPVAATQQGRVPFKALEALGEARKDAWIGVCGARWPVVPETRTRIFEFAERFRKSLVQEIAVKSEPTGTWVKHDLRRCDVAAQFPAEPKEQTTPIQTKTGPVSAVAAVFELPDGAGAMSLACSSGGRLTKPSAAVIDGARDGMLKSVDGKLVKESEILGGREILFEAQGEQGLARILSVGGRVIVATAGPVKAFGPDSVKRFVNSVQLLDHP